jgi:hypothetical protein
MKHTVTELEGTNEPILFAYSISGNYYVDTFFGNFPMDVSLYDDTIV